MNASPVSSAEAGDAKPRAGAARRIAQVADFPKLIFLDSWPLLCAGQLLEGLTLSLYCGQ